MRRGLLVRAAERDAVIFARSFERVVQSVAACGSRDRCVISRPFGGRRSACGAIDDDPSLSVSLFAHARSLSFCGASVCSTPTRTYRLRIRTQLKVIHRRKIKTFSAAVRMYCSRCIRQAITTTQVRHFLYITIPIQAERAVKIENFTPLLFFTTI